MQRAAIALILSFTIASRVAVASGQTSAPKSASVSEKAATSAKLAKGKTKTIPVTLPEAQAGQFYQAVLEVVLNIPYGRAQCKIPNMPAWLVFDPNQFQFSGVPTETAATTYDLELTVTNVDNPANSQVLSLTLPVRIGPAIAYANPKDKPKPLKGVTAAGGGLVLPAAGAGPAATAVNASQASQVGQGGRAAATPTPASGITTVLQDPVLRLTSEFVEGSTEIDGILNGVQPGGSTPAVEVWIRPEGERLPYQAPLKSPEPKSTATVLQTAVKADGTFSAALATPLSAGQEVTIRIAPQGGAGPLVCRRGSAMVDCDGRLRQEPRRLPTEIPYPKIFVSSELTAGAQTISGHVEGIPQPPIAATQADPKTGAAATPGNLPLIGVDIHDPAKGVSRASLAVSLTQNQPAVQVGVDGTFSLRLGTALAVGQEVTLVAVAPQGHRFVGGERSGDRAWSSVMQNPAGEIEVPVHGYLPVYAGLALIEPVLTTQLGDNVTALTGTATPSQSTTATFNVALQRLNPDKAIKIEEEETNSGKVPTTDNLNVVQKAAVPDVSAAPEQKRDLSDREDVCVTLDNIEHQRMKYELLTSASGNSLTVATNSTGAFSLTLAHPLFEGEKFRLVQVLPAGAQVTGTEESRCFSSVYTVPTRLDWGRVHADFTAGLMTSNSNQLTSTDSGNFTQAHEFLALTLDKSWALPGCYLRSFNQDRPPKETDKRLEDMCYDWSSGKWEAAKRRQHWNPGVTSYFEARLTSIPVATVSTSATCSSSASGSSGSSGSSSSCPSSSSASPGSSGSSGSSSSTSSTSPSSVLSSNPLAQAQTARLGTGIYFPFLITRWNYHGQPNALFFAPLAKIGFDTVTGASAITVTPTTPGASISGGTATITAESLYNFRGYGARIGHYKMTESAGRAPEITSYLDVIFGPYSNLESLICNRTPANSTITSTSGVTTTTYNQVPGFPAPTTYSGSKCSADYPSFYNAPMTASVLADNPNAVWQPWETRKRVYRLDFEGLLKIPDTWLYVGFNANLGQKSVLTGQLDHGYAAPDDLRFFFGTRFDISTLLSKMGISPF
jgi:hypothetical protein